MKYLLAILMILISFNSYCCNCKTISKESEYMNSDFVLIGQILEVTASTFTVKPIELFKGDTLNNIVVSIDVCSIFPKENENWLIYTNKLDNGFFSISQCGWSRSLNLHVFEKVPPPPVNDKKIDEIRTTFYFNERIAYLETQLDILSLRQIRISNDLNTNGLKKSDYNKIEKLAKTTFILLVIIPTVLTLLILYVLLRKYKPVVKTNHQFKKL